MTHPRIYFPQCLHIDELCRISGEQRHYLKTVLRLKIGETVVLFDGRGLECEGVIRRESGEDLFIEVIKRSAVHGRGAARITLCQSVPKAAKLDLIVQKGTELGVHRIIPYISERSVPKLSREKALLKADRWRKIAMEACRQSRRTHLPVIEEISDFDHMIAMLPEDCLKIILWEEETTKGLRRVLEDNRCGAAGDIAVAIGPEGGFTAGEIGRATGAGFISAGLGKCILRTETAALAVLSILQYETGAIGALDE